MNHIITIGLNHKTAPISTREKLAFTSSQVKDLICLLLKEGISETVILSTCNRTEFYLAAEDESKGHEALVALLCRYCDLDEKAFVPYLYKYLDSEAVRHLFEVSAGLDSLVVGETQILGQVKEAYQFSSEHEGAGPVLHGLFQQALTAGKRVHRETGINDNAASVSYAAVELARRIWGQLSGKSILLIGAGKMSELAARHLFESGASALAVINRSKERASELVRKFNGEASAAPYNQLEEKLAEADIVISSTGAPHIIISGEVVKKAMAERGRRPMLLVDIALPRDIEPSVSALENVHLYNIDKLESVVQGNMQKRQEEAQKARSIIAGEVKSFMEWYRTREVVPVIAALRKKADRVRKAELDKYSKKLQKLSPKERQLVEKLSKSLVNSLLKDPVLNLKDAAREEEAELYKNALALLFDLESAEGNNREDNDSIETVKENTAAEQKQDCDRLRVYDAAEDRRCNS